MAILAWRNQVEPARLLEMPNRARRAVTLRMWLFWVVFVAFVVGWNGMAAWEAWRVMCAVGDKLRGLIP